MAPPPSTTPFRVPPALIGVGVLVMVVGFGLPRLLPAVDPGAPPVSPTAPAPAAPAPAPAGASDPGLRWSLVKLAACFAVVCGGCVLVVKLGAGRVPPKPGQTRVLATLSPDGRCRVQLVQAGERRLLVGLDPGGVKALLELPGPAPDLPPAPAPAGEPVVVGPIRVTVPAGPVAAAPARAEAPAAEPPLVDQITAIIARLTAKPPA